MTTGTQADIAWLLDTLEREWADAAEQLDRWDELDQLERREFLAEWPLLADWWDRALAYRSRQELDADQQQRVDAVRRLIREHLPQLERALGADNLMLDGV